LWLWNVPFFLRFNNFDFTCKAYMVLWWLTRKDMHIPVYILFFKTLYLYPLLKCLYFFYRQKEMDCSWCTLSSWSNLKIFADLYKVCFWPMSWRLHFVDHPFFQLVIVAFVLLPKNICQSCHEIMLDPCTLLSLTHRQ